MDLEVYNNTGKLIFSMDGKWLYPLIEFYRFVINDNPDLTGAKLKDKVIGRAAAAIIISSGVKQCHAGLISRKAVSYLEKYGILYSFDKITETILCKTEGLIDDGMTPDAALQMILERAKGVVK